MTAVEKEEATTEGKELMFKYEFYFINPNVHSLIVMFSLKKNACKNQYKTIR